MDSLWQIWRGRVTGSHYLFPKPGNPPGRGSGVGQGTDHFIKISEGTHEEMIALKKLLEAGDADQT